MESNLPVVVQHELNDIAAEIYYLNQKTAEFTFEIGKRLARAREIFRHEGGGFQGWLETTFNESRTKAYKYIQFYEKSSSIPLVGHLKDIEGVSQKTLFALSENSTPDEVVKDAVKRIQAGENITSATIQEMVETQNRQDLEQIIGKINLRFCKAVLESGELIIGVKERFEESIFHKWLSHVLWVPMDIVAFHMNAYDTFKDAPDDVLKGMSIDNLHNLSGTKYQKIDLELGKINPETWTQEEHDSILNSLGVSHREQLFLKWEAMGPTCIWMLALFDVGKELLKVQKIIGKKGLNSWIQLSLHRNKEVADYLEKFISDFKVDLLRSESKEHLEQAA